MTMKQWLLSSSVTLACLVSTAAVAGSIENYSPVTAARLENPEPGNWLMIRGNYKGWSYSSLDQINTSNVKSLAPVWSFATGVDAGRARRQVWQGRLERKGRGLEDRLLHDHGAPGREGQDSGRRGGRRVRRARLRPGIRRRDRQAGVEDLHDSGTRRAGKRYLGEARHLEDRRCLHLDDRQL